MSSLKKCADCTIWLRNEAGTNRWTAYSTADIRVLEVELGLSFMKFDGFLLRIAMSVYRLFRRELLQRWQLFCHRVLFMEMCTQNVSGCPIRLFRFVSTVIAGSVRSTFVGLVIIHLHDTTAAIISLGVSSFIEVLSVPSVFKRETIWPMYPFLCTIHYV